MPLFGDSGDGPQGGLTLLLSGKSIVLGFTAQFALILGCALLTPTATVGCVHVLEPLTARWLGVTGKMAARNVTSSFDRTAMAITALMVAIATTVGVGLLISSFRLAVASWLHNILRADMYIPTPGLPPPGPASEFDFDFKARIGSTPGVAALSTVRRCGVRDAGGIIDRSGLRAWRPSIMPDSTSKRGIPLRCGTPLSTTMQ